MNDLLGSLTPAQREAVSHVEGPLLVLAGPGSGKTRVVTSRVAHLLQQGIPARQILALTFTNKAADEMRSRVEQLAPNQPVWMSTFHRFCARLLRHHASSVGLMENYTIYDTEDSRKVLRRTFEELDLGLTHTSIDQITAAISRAKNQLITAQEYVPRKGSVVGSIVQRVYPAYQARLLASCAVDFDDLLLHTATLLRENPEIRASLDARYRYIMVDEYQDTNLAQYIIVRALSVDYPNLAVTGDPDQSIYGWRGANLRNILDFEKDFPRVRVVRLEQNYRSTKRILRVADALISNNRMRKLKRLFTENDEGQTVRLISYATHKDEAESIAAHIAHQILSKRRKLRDFAIFYRVNALSRSLEFALRDQGVPYQMVNGLEFFQRKEIKDVLAYLHLVNNLRNDVAFLRAVNTPPRGIGKTTLGRLREHANRYGLSLLQAARESGLVESLNKRAAVTVAKFVTLFDRICEHATGEVEELIGQTLSHSGLQEFYKESDLAEDEERLANIQELLTAGKEFDEHNPGGYHLEEFLEQASLVNDTDDWESENDKVTLMTLHSAKGLEFPVVFMIAAEEGLLPHRRSLERPETLEEERRLMFVGITRAQEQLQISLARRREFRGMSGGTIPSSFLMELPRDEMELVEHHQAIGFSEDEDFEPSQYGETQSFEEEKNAESFEQFQQPDALTSKTTRLPNLMTAAAMTAEDVVAQRATSPEAFHQDMVVIHPEYGPGKIIALGGSGEKRSATVIFASGVGRKKFVLAMSPLRPAKQANHG